MKDQLKAIRADLSNLTHLGAVQRVLDTLDQLEAMVGEQEPVAWTLTETLSKRETTTSAYLWFSNPVNSSWTPLYAAPVAQQYEAGDSAGDMASQAADAFRAAQQAQAEAEDFSELPDPVAHYGVEDRGAIERLGKKAQAEAVPIQECYGDCPTNPATCANPCKFNGRPAPQQAEAVPPDVVRDAAAYHWLTTTLTSPEPWVVFQKAFGHMTEERPPTKAELDAVIYAAIAQQKGGV